MHESQAINIVVGVWLFLLAFTVLKYIDNNGEVRSISNTTSNVGIFCLLMVVQHMRVLP